MAKLSLGWRGLKMRKYFALTTYDKDPIRYFWTMNGALEFKHKHNSIVILYKWNGSKWVKIEPWEAES